ncbi:stage V sporulation protein B [Haloimpatiens lingqiaonensis]|uniref:stage V sporulation protein B n=1 Tax=Haloimpatiens lingqiaonensis TaxID=1380675 RepID=UPI0010FE3179|nr:stage V sporulation protein B [Haloimpatiens lingqiaonensis]
MNKDSFFKNSIILTCSNFITGILKFMFSIILSQTLGAMGLGLYSLIMPVYDFFAVVVCGGMITAMSKQCAYFNGKKEFGNLHKSVKASLFFDFFWALIIALILFLFSPLISNNIIKDTRALYSLWVICPAIIFVALSAILKGYFYGVSKVFTPSLIDILEKAVRMIVIISLICYFNLTDVTKTVTITYMALTIGEFFSFIFLFIFYKKNKSNYPIYYKNTKSSIELIWGILVISLPLCINGMLTTGLYTVSTLMLPKRLICSGLLHEEALALIGKFSGMAFTIIFFPFIAVNSLATILVPDISQNLSKGNFSSLQKRFSEVINISFVLGMATLFICLSIPNNLGQLFFKRNDLAPFIKFAALSAPVIYVSSTTFGILNGLGKQKIVLRNSVLSALIELILIYILVSIPNINIYGYGISLIVTSLFTLVANLYEIKKEYFINFPFINILTHLFLGIIVFLILTILNNLVTTNNLIIKNIFLILLGFSVFIFSSSILYNILNHQHS